MGWVGPGGHENRETEMVLPPRNLQKTEQMQVHLAGEKVREGGLRRYSGSWPEQL